MDKSTLTALGIGTGLVTLISAVAVGFFVYKSYHEQKLIKLKIELAQRELGKPTTATNANNIIGD